MLRGRLGAVGFQRDIPEQRDQVIACTSGVLPKELRHRLKSLLLG
jgi:hypothetical protein